MEKLAITKDEKMLEVTESVLNHARITQSCLEHLIMNDVNLSHTKITDANLSDLEIDGAQIGGAFFHNVGMPPPGSPYYKEGAVQRPSRFEDCNLSALTVTNCNLSQAGITDCNLTGVQIEDCNMTGMKINGILVSELLAAYKR